MQDALGNVDGVQKTKIDFGAKTATVTCEPGTDPAKLIAALEAKGFGGQVKK